MIDFARKLIFSQWHCVKITHQKSVSHELRFVNLESSKKEVFTARNDGNGDSDNLITSFSLTLMLISNSLRMRAV